MILILVLVLVLVLALVAIRTTDFLTPPAILLLLESARRIGISVSAELDEEVDVVALVRPDGRAVGRPLLSAVCAVV